MVGFDTVIKNGMVVTTEGIARTDIAINGEKIVAIGNDENLFQGKRTIDAKEKFVIPGLVDPHAHLYIPPTPENPTTSEIIRSETQAAAAGGVTTTINCLFEHGSGSILEGSNKFISTFEDNGYVDLGLNAAIFNLNHVNEMREALEYGLSSFKFLLSYRGPDTIPGLPALDDGIAYLGFEQIGKLVNDGYKTFARVHAEDVEIYFALKHRYQANNVEPKTYTEVRPSFLEIEAMQKSMIWSKVTGCPLYIVHMTIKEGPGIILKAKEEGIDVVGETCPQYLVLNTDNTDKTVSKVNPPIRHREDNEALWQGIKAGIIDFVGTDHGPSIRTPEIDFWTALGMGGLETLLPIMISEGVNKGKITLERLVELCCYNPAKKYGLTPRKGIIAPGSDADLVIIDLNKKTKVNVKNFYSWNNFTCYEDWELTGWPVLTMIRGNVIMDDGKVVGKPGFGRFIAAKIK